MKTQFFIALRCFLALTVITGLIYPLVITVVSGIAFPSQSQGSMLKNPQGRLIGSALIGQDFSAPGQFWGRPSQTATQPYNALASGGSNLGTSNSGLNDVAQTRRLALAVGDTAIPVDLVTSSGSGLDPHISPAAARFQITRVAKVRGIAPEVLEKLINECTEQATFGALGQTRVNVVLLNLALDNSLTPSHLGEKR